MPVKVVVDSAAALPRDLAAQFDVVVVPMTLVIGDESVRDGELPMDDLLERLSDGVTTSTPSPGDWVSAVEPTLDDEGAVLLTVSSTMSGTHASALVAADVLGDRVKVVDTRSAAGGEGLVVLAAAEAAAAGAELDKVLRVAEDAAAQVRLVATLDSLEQLVRSGRVPGIAGAAGKLLGVNPLFGFRDGSVQRLRPAFSREAAMTRLLGAWRTDRPHSESECEIVALHAGARDAAEHLLESVRAEIEPRRSFLCEFSPVMVAHTGAGLVGLAWRWC